MLATSSKNSRSRSSKGLSAFESTALLLQGGGALGSYQAGVYEALAEADVEPDWVAGISIGAINSALIAGNSPDMRVEKLRKFWEIVTESAVGVPTFDSIEIADDATRRMINASRAMSILLWGAPGFFKPRTPSPLAWPFGKADAISHYDVAPLKATLESLVDFDRINSGEMRFSVGAVNVLTGNFTYFDNSTHKITSAHVIASGSLPPGFPATEIDGEFYWDGGLVSNTPLQWVLESRPRQDTLAFQVDVWSSVGEMPSNLIDTDVRTKEIRFSSRTRAATDQYKKTQKLRIALASLIDKLPAELRNSNEVKTLEAEADEKVCNIVQLIYQAKKYEGAAKDFEFSRRTMLDHWASGYEDASRALSHPEVFQRPDRLEGVHTFDFREHRDAR